MVSLTKIKFTDMYKRSSILLLASLSLFCNNRPTNPDVSDSPTKIPSKTTTTNITSFDSSIATIHVLVALCDNKYQGIVKVPAGIGNGQDPNSNLYWGCAAGIRTYFKNSKQWQFVKKYRIDSIRLERAIFKHKKHNYYLIADAYDGRFIKKCTIDFLKSCAGQLKDTVMIKEKVLGIHGNGKLVAYIGHNGLMDFSLSQNFSNTDNKSRDAIMLACISKHYFWNYIKDARANPLLWSTGLMSPEAYTLHDALESYMDKESAEVIRTSAANAYSRYQKCSLKASKRLLVSCF